MNNQPFYVIEDCGYERMMKKLNDGAPFVKSYITTCPHNNKDDCRCLFFKNYLSNGDMVRDVNGVIKPVYKLSDIIKMFKKN